MLIIGFLLLIIGANLLVKSSSNIAKKLHISEILIGLTIVAIGTSLPELVITIFSANYNSADLIIGNSIGSNLCNLLFILGGISIIKPVNIEKSTIAIHLPIAFISNIIILCLVVRRLQNLQNILNFKEGIVLIILYVIYFVYTILLELKQNKNSVKKEIKNKNNKILLSIIYIIIGIMLLKIGGDIVVENAIYIASIYGVSEDIIGLTVIAIGTALPEFITSLVAIIKKEGELALGNLIGSCILNSLLILGIGAIITPLIFSNSFIYNLLLLCFSILFIGVYCFIGKRYTITRYKGGILLLLFVVYVINLFK